jgi:hypothetical protein
MATLNTLSLVSSDGTAFSLNTNKVIYAYDNDDSVAVLTYATDGGQNQEIVLSVDTATLQGYSTAILFLSDVNQADGTVTEMCFNNQRVNKIIADGSDCVISYVDNASGIATPFAINDTAANTSTACGSTIALTDSTSNTVYYINKLLVGNITAVTDSVDVLGSAAVVAAGTTMIAGTTQLTLTGGTFGVVAKALVTNTKFVATPVVAAGGTGYTTGDHVSLTTGTGTQAVFAVTAVAGVVTAIASIVSAGNYTVNPTVGANATTHSTGAGNDDLTITFATVKMGALTVSVAQAGEYSTPPSNPVSTTGGNNGATLTASFGSGSGTGCQIEYNNGIGNSPEQLDVQETKAQVTTLLG